VKAIERRRFEKSKRRIQRRLYRQSRRTPSGRVFDGANAVYEVAEKIQGTVHGGIGAFCSLVKWIGLADAIDRRLNLLRIHLPYHESDHVLNLTYNALCDGTCLDDIEIRRNDETYLNAIGALKIPDPTTAGDFLRRFDKQDVTELMEAIDDARRAVWACQPPAFFAEAVIDADGTMVPTTGECKQGMDLSYQGEWGYHPLVVTLANTGELLRVYNRPGNRPSHEMAYHFLDDAIDLARSAGFRKILLRGDTDFTQTQRLDQWDGLGNVRFVFGIDAHPKLVGLADDLPPAAWTPLQRRAKMPRVGPARARPENVKEKIVRERGFRNLRLESEDVAAFAYRPALCQKTYRIVVVRKNLTVTEGQVELFDDTRYFFYLTNLADEPSDRIVFLANDRCNQENVIAQLKGGVRALSSPVDSQTANWAYMVCVGLAWNLKAWWALLLPEGKGRWADRHNAEKRAVLRMEFKRFAQAFIRLPCQVVHSGRRLILRLLNWNQYLPIFYRLVRRLRT
jgi:hypothetical protein